ncbi:hypothetical protein CB0940_00216 [Cercospora beticola]|uniref:Uncharacterized protein n=1 Tax=Cercospora beticola TaxID=122368 RepID=A0A2G5IBG4_CERBT|nr:hypothetical protein CB0940_00216 [Cercospora beticola]PIB02111.1 hypothetical protein CB0940_00216 [Cercospora beticola]WPA95621.1 hypothetical protein RHO25_000223 [Cercospora beticola]CAK1356144.1 unnamed protein product [Cercospora beticola]
MLLTTRLLTATAAFAALTYAQDQNQNQQAGSESQTQDAAELLSVVSILQTALPSSLLNEALTNSAGVSSQIASQFAAGETPGWFSSLPNEVKTYLVPTLTDLPTQTGVSSMMTETGSMTTGTGEIPFLSLLLFGEVGFMVYGMLTDVVVDRSSSTRSSRTSTATESSRTSEAGAGAAAATGAVVAGMAGLAGFFGVLAL